MATPAQNNERLVADLESSRITGLGGSLSPLVGLDSRVCRSAAILVCSSERWSVCFKNSAITYLVYHVIRRVNAFRAVRVGADLSVL